MKLIRVSLPPRPGYNHVLLFVDDDFDKESIEAEHTKTFFGPAAVTDVWDIPEDACNRISRDRYYPC